nr:PIN domain-containing protein [Candidatus Bathyarchaeota archaeon]
METPRELYDTNVIIEALKEGRKINGYTTILNLVEFPKGLEVELGVLTPSIKDYLLAIEISQTMVEQGTPIPAVDTVISAVAINRKLTLVTKDKHFTLVQRAYPELKIKRE